ncbi:uncharacterized protein YutE (UPF0331/DUF86 family) [Jeotgalibacillus terrae]|nr:uncharacterized protein YutE (UPF0331/DUF86 family) [Jeotgalibacillus terrae]
MPKNLRAYGTLETDILMESEEIMYFVDRETIEQTLVFMEEQLAFLQQHTTWDTKIGQLALERSLHTVIESIIDVGNSMIDGFIMRDPGSYEDIVDILEDEKVIGKDMHGDLVNAVKLRKHLVQEFTQVDHQMCIDTFTSSEKALLAFPLAVRNYLKNELGPVSAFRR